MINWRSYFRNTAEQSVYAKHAEVHQQRPFAASDTNIEDTSRLENALRGRAIELWSDLLGEHFWLVADEADAAIPREPRGTVYTAVEARRIVALRDPAVVAETHDWKRRFDGVVNSK